MRITLNRDGRWWTKSGGIASSYLIINPDVIGRSRQDALREPFLWKTEKGEVWEVEDMNTSHLFNTYKMLHNNTVAPAFRIGCFIPHPEIKAWDECYIDKAIRRFQEELAFRSLKDPYDQQFIDIIDNRKYLKL